ncbi:uncharacterized protein EV154DRAFT_554329 [Mucor mucedo]|uniref:uncharacterized protein n=1 Tax=Mucor mucedo TaxID=29922 RepID=UPI00221FB03F|nr:uncharacterized protein EV154DRAFT_554329 [Mucor mucedo]KAI7887867.1 hypothetical protein EV154DRAFT_554329 [Mucor mucedo]
MYIEANYWCNWLLNYSVYQTSWEDYAGLLKDGPTALAGNIKNDTFRTFSTDTKFTGNVREDLLIRMLNTFVRVNNENNSHATMVCNQLNVYWIESLTHIRIENTLLSKIRDEPDVARYQGSQIYESEIHHQIGQFFVLRMFKMKDPNTEESTAQWYRHPAYHYTLFYCVLCYYYINTSLTTAIPVCIEKGESDLMQRQRCR